MEEHQPTDRYKLRWDTPGLAIAAIALFLYVIVCVRSAWIGDDAFITLRTVDNFVNGYGLRWNVAERVQSYTHPLWMFTLSAFYFLTREAYYTTIFVSLATSTTAAYMLVRYASRTLLIGALSLILLVASKAFIDYSTSGLENPLTHLILLAFISTLCGRIAGKHTLIVLYALGGLGILTRMDTALFYLPGLIYASKNLPPRSIIQAALIGFLPLALWEIFSIIYYGFPFPNTAYAKLNTGIPGMDLAYQGLRYLQDSLVEDPITIILIVAGYGVAAAWRDRLSLVLTASSILYILYVIKIGGDFMSGRFLAGPLLLAVVTIGRAPLSERTRGGLAAIAIAISLVSPNAPLRADEDYGDWSWTESGIMDERAFYYEKYGLLRALNGHLRMPTERPFSFDRITLPQIRGGIGFAGFNWGPDHHIIDIFALSDPLLARMPNEDLDWRIGHFRRAIPNGYAETATGDDNRIERQPIAEYYDRLQKVTRGPLWSLERWREIVYLNTGWGGESLADIHRAQAQVWEAKKLLEKEERDRALVLLEQALELDPHSSPAALLTAGNLREMGRPREAGRYILNVFARVLAVTEYDVYRDELFRIAIDIEHQGDLDDAEELIREAVQLDPTFVGGHLNLGFTELGRNQVRSALPHFLRAMILIPIADEKIMKWMEERRRSLKELEPLESLLPFDMRSPAHWLDLYTLTTETIDRDAATQALIAGLRYAGPDERIVETLLAHIQWLVDQNELRKAGNLCLDALMFSPDLAILHYDVGALREALGDLDGATSAYRRATELLPEDQEMQAALFRVTGLAAQGQNETAD